MFHRADPKPTIMHRLKLFTSPFSLSRSLRLSRAWLLSRVEQAGGEKEGHLSPSHKSILIEYNLTVKLTRT